MLPPVINRLTFRFTSDNPGTTRAARAALARHRRGVLGGALPLDGAARELVRAGPFDLTMQHPNPRQTWVHSCCSVEKLKRALADPNVTAIEADIVMSSGAGGKHAAGVPVMAHPPRKSSDLVFSQFMDLVVADGSRHIKLDFKESAAVEPCLALLAARAPELLENGQVDAPSIWLPWHPYAETVRSGLASHHPSSVTGRRSGSTRTSSPGRTLATRPSPSPRRPSSRSAGGSARSRCSRSAGASLRSAPRSHTPSATPR